MRLRLGTRLALLYAALFLLGGAILVAGLVVSTRQFLADPVAAEVRDRVVRQLAVVAGAELVALTVLAAVVGAIVSRRLLARVRRVSEATRATRGTWLRGRLSPPGRGDEVKELGDTLDAMLVRLNESFDAQRRFSAGAGDGLRTSLTEAKAAAEVALGKSNATVEQWRTAGEQVVASLDRAQRLLDSLLLLARGEQPVGEVEEDDLTDLAADALDEMGKAIGKKRLRVRTGFAPAPVRGDPTLLAAAVANVVANAVHHNHKGGELEVTTGGDGRDSWIRVANSGPDMSTVDVRRLADAFNRGAKENPDHDGLGLGLSIAAAVARNHGGAITVTARKGGGLDVLLRVPGHA
jgi:two-component system, OmpR family, sensor histidine kinase VanS